MKKKGFTLIELLAVIVILAIIAVITVPKIADMISSSRQGGAEDSFYGTLKAAELGYTKALQSNTNLKESTCTIIDSKITCTNGVKIDVSGKTPESGTLVIDSAGSTIAKALTLNGYKCYGDLSTENPCVKADVEVASETLIKKVTTSGAGLYKDSYDETRYIYRGGTPNNNIKFNNDDWLIISVENDGTIKIIKKEILINKAFDMQDRTEVGGYCTKATGCNIWSKQDSIITTKVSSGIVSKDSTIKTYLNETYYNSLDAKSKNAIDNHNFNIGFIEWDLNSGAEKMSADEKTIKWKDNIGLFNPSDYMKATLDNKCTTIGVSRESSVCKNDNYLALADDIWWWSINGTDHTSAQVAGIGTASSPGGPGAICSNGVNTDEPSVRPVLYLKNLIELTGSGSQSDPYIIK